MRLVAETRLFWFLKDGIQIDLSNKANLDMVVQHTLTRGRTSDIKKLLDTITNSAFMDSFNRIKGFLPAEVRRFWEEWNGDLNRTSN